MKAIINGKVFTVTGQTYDKATVLIENGKIKAVGPDVQVRRRNHRRCRLLVHPGTDRLPYPYLQLQ